MTSACPDRRSSVLAAGIAVKMITGDHAATAGAIGRQLGMTQRIEVVTGADLDETPDAALPALAVRAEVFARSEEHTSELQSLIRISYAVLCLQTKTSIRE